MKNFKAFKKVWEDFSKRILVVGNLGIEKTDVFTAKEIETVEQFIKEYEQNCECNKVKTPEFKSEFNYVLKGKGRVFVIDTDKYPDQTISIGQEVVIDGVKGIVGGYEYAENLFGQIAERVGIVVK